MTRQQMQESVTLQLTRLDISLVLTAIEKRRDFLKSGSAQMSMQQANILINKLGEIYSYLEDAKDGEFDNLMQG